MKILYAEDERQLSMAVSEILKMEGFDVDPVYDGEEALAHIKAANYDLVILDIMMPRLDGIKVLSIMRANEIFTPVILLTAKAQIEDRIEGFNEGADDYLAKPFATKELLAHINALMRRNSEYKVRNIEYANFKLDRESNEIKTEMGSLILSPKESGVLSELVKNKDLPVEEKVLLDILGAENDEGAADLYIAYLRNKLRQIHAHVVLDKTDDGYLIREDA